VSGELELVYVGSSVGQYSFPISVTAGKTYVVGGSVAADASSSAASLSLKTSSSATSGSYLATVFATSTDGSAASGQVTYVATSTTTIYVVLRQGVASTTRLWDNISVRELPGNHATQGTAASRPILARVPEGGRRNLLERTEEFDDAYWTKAAGTATLSADAVGRDGTANSATTLVDSAAGGTGAVTIQKVFGGAAANGDYTLSFYAKQDQLSDVTVAFGTNQILTNAEPYVTFNLASGTKTEVLHVADPFSSTITPSGNGFYRCTVSFRAQSTVLHFLIQLGGGGRFPTVDLDGTSSVLVEDVQLELGSTATDYQKVVSEYDVTEAGVTSLDYLSFDGSDDFMKTPSALTHATTSNYFAAFAITVPTSLDTFFSYGGYISGGFLLQRFDSTTIRFARNSDNLLDSTNSETAEQVITAISNASGGTIKVDGSIDVTNSDIRTITGKTITLGRREDGATQYYAGKLYGSVFRIATSTTAEINSTEAYLAAKSGVTL
jgi:hypothetical protein